MVDEPWLWGWGGFEGYKVLPPPPPTAPLQQAKALYAAASLLAAPQPWSH